MGNASVDSMAYSEEVEAEHSYGVRKSMTWMRHEAKHDLIR